MRFFTKAQKYKSTKIQKHKNSIFFQEPRLMIVRVVIFLFGGVLLFKLFHLQIVQHDFYTDIAFNQHSLFEKLVARRGEIYAQSLNSSELKPLAVNREYSLIFAQPRQIEDPKSAAEKLSPILQVPVEEILPILDKPEDPYEPLLHKASDEIKQQVEALQIAGVYSSPELFRYYPEEHIGSHVLGFVSFDGKEYRGQYGVEGFFEEELKGASGYLSSNRDASGRLIAVSARDFEKAKDGSDIVLTIDGAIQYTACSELNQAVVEHQAEAGALIILEPSSGKVLTMCSFPDYDPNKYNEIESLEIFNNLAVFGGYEPGSVFKGITMAAALDSGVVTPQTKYTDEGSYSIGGFTIRNSEDKVYGEKSMVEVLELSINTGAIYAAEKTGKEKFREYVKNFGFGDLTNIELPSENPGDISSLSKPGGIYTATASFGQGIRVTPLQLVSAYSAIANGGKLMRPYLVDRIIPKEGEPLYAQPQEIRQVTSSRAATLLSGMLVSVVEQGHAKRAQVKGYHLGGKTGTAQVPDYEKGGYSDKTIHSFVGFGPVDEPRFAMVVRIDNPKDVRYAEGSAAPVFAKVAKFMLDYMQVEPEF